MTIYADTSFLVSYLYPRDPRHATAAHFFRVQPADAVWLTYTWSQFETINTLRQLCLQKPGPTPPVIEAIRLPFKHWHKKGPFRLDRVDFDDALTDSRTMSAAFGASLRMRSADTLHIAILEQLNPDAFVTRDSDQCALARRRGFTCHLLP